jgi:hypothetical protein
LRAKFAGVKGTPEVRGPFAVVPNIPVPVPESC